MERNNHGASGKKKPKTVRVTRDSFGIFGDYVDSASCIILDILQDFFSIDSDQNTELFSTFSKIHFHKIK